MINSIEIINEEGQSVNINIIVQFSIEELNKQYIVYTINDDGVSEKVPVLIAETSDENGKYMLKKIPENEVKTVLMFYDNVRDTLSGKR